MMIIWPRRPSFCVAPQLLLVHDLDGRGRRDGDEHDLILDMSLFSMDP